MPALDVLEGRCVRLSEGRRERGDDRGRRPGRGRGALRRRGRAVAPPRRPRRRVLRPPDAGARRARSRPPACPVQVGGGLRDAEAIQAALDAGAARAIVGTAALDRRPAQLAERFGERLVVAVDARDGKVVADGWVAETGAHAPASSRAAAPTPASGACSSRAPAATARSPGRTCRCSEDVLERRRCPSSPPAGSPRSTTWRRSATSAARARSSGARSGRAGSAWPRRSAYVA